MAKSFIVITGLPASGKTTLARQLGEELGIPVIDKDDFLEDLLGSVEEYDADFRYRCSREADKSFKEAACKCSVATAVQRFKNRNRHPGHGDNRSDLNTLSRCPQSWVEPLMVVHPG